VRDDEKLALILIAVVLIVSIVVEVLFLLTWYRCFSKMRPENREMEPGLVWLNLIPIFNLGWTFYVVAKFANSIKKELGSDAGDGGWALGLAYAILMVSGLIPIPGLGILLGIAGMIVWIIYWIKISDFSKKIGAPVAV
jgi:hypothetical protein